MPFVTFPTKDKSHMLVGVGSFVQWERGLRLCCSFNKESWLYTWHGDVRVAGPLVTQRRERLG